MENTCKLRAKCLKKDEHLDKCNNPECQNFTHPSRFNKLLVAFAEEDWKGPVFCCKQCFNSNKKVLEAATNKGKGRVPWHTDGRTPELNYMAVIINWLMTDGNYSRWRGGDKQNGMTKVGSPMNSVNSSKTKGSL